MRKECEPLTVLGFFLVNICKIKTGVEGKNIKYSA